ncbi:taste receptor type 2 member 125-like [Peromyscus leucopus]|uniref:taste receptor type 2 member 125-like n=1 Tax=Peromyscus leucopus TaxID=10041 RepID=UPI0010A0F8F8|nr:taste receptor type 2 member 125-like [Peromyscus leucopus]
MCDFLQFMLTVILSIESIREKLRNIFVALVNIMDWIKRRKISTVVQILTVLAISRISLFWSPYSDHRESEREKTPATTNTMFTLISFTVTLIAFLLLIFLLWRHLKNTQFIAKGSRDTSTTAHIKALKMVVTFLSLYTTFFLLLFLLFCNSNFKQKSPIILFLLALGFAFPSAHPWVLILENKKMR